ncbi:hypothetical protein GCM10010518_45900 [Kitasatospora cinereorecta]
MVGQGAIEKGNGHPPPFRKAQGGGRASWIGTDTFCSAFLAEGHRPERPCDAPARMRSPCACAAPVRPELRAGIRRDRAGRLTPAEGEDAGSFLP